MPSCLLNPLKRGSRAFSHADQYLETFALRANTLIMAGFTFITGHIMLRAYLAIGLLIGVIAITISNSGDIPWVGGGDSVRKTSCDILAGPCTWSSREGQWSATLEPGEEGSQGVEYHLEIKSPVDPERFLAILRGESMYMGDYPIPLVREEDGHYTASFTAPFCATGTDMIWRIELQNGQQPLEITGDRLTFNAVK